MPQNRLGWLEARHTYFVLGGVFIRLTWRKGEYRLMQRKEAGANIVERLMKIRLFAGMSPDLIAEIVDRISAGVRCFAKGEIVVYEGTKTKWVVPVLSGRLTVFESGASGERHPVRVVEKGHLFGATMVTSALEYYPGMAMATAPSEVVFLEIAKIKEIWREPRFAKFFENLYSIIATEVHDCWRRMAILSCKKAEDRFMFYLRWYASEIGESDVRLPFPTSEACAEYLGVTRTALSLAVKRLLARGEIAHPSHGRFVIRGIL